MINPGIMAALDELIEASSRLAHEGVWAWKEGTTDDGRRFILLCAIGEGADSLAGTMDHAAVIDPRSTLRGLDGS